MSKTVHVLCLHIPKYVNCVLVQICTTCHYLQSGSKKLRFKKNNNKKKIKNKNNHCKPFSNVLPELVHNRGRGGHLKGSLPLHGDEFVLEDADAHEHDVLGAQGPRGLHVEEKLVGLGTGVESALASGCGQQASLLAVVSAERLLYK